MELFAALSLSVAYYFLVSNFALVGAPENQTNGWVFSACSIPGFHLQNLEDVWKGRLSGLLLSGYVFDFAVKGDTYNTDQFQSIFGLYHACWLFALFLLIIFSLRHSLLINFGIFAGLIYNFSPAAGLYFYPWDIPATLYFTLAALLFDQRRMRLMIAAICVGCFFKETVLTCAILLLFATEWPWRRRLLAFAGVVMVYLLGKKLLTGCLSIKVAALSMGDANSLRGLLQTWIPAANIKTLLSPTLNHVLFTNAGTLLAVLVLGWRRRFLPFMAVILAFVVGQFFFAAWVEFRTFMQILPLSLILLSERWRDPSQSASPPEETREDSPSTGPARHGLPAIVAAVQEAVGSHTRDPLQESRPICAWRDTLRVFMVLAGLLIVVPTALAGWRYWAVSESISKQRGGRPEGGSRHLRPVGRAGELIIQSQTLREAYERDELELAAVSESRRQIPEAIARYQHVLELDKNSLGALKSLAWVRATAPDPQWRNGVEAVRLAERACELDGYNHATLLGVLSAAYAEAGQFEQAVQMAERTRALALAHGQEELAATMAEMLELYKLHRAYHQTATNSPAAR